MTSRKPIDRTSARSHLGVAEARPVEREDVATLLLDLDCTVRRLSPAAARLLALAPEAVGRPVGELGQRLPDPELMRDVGSVLASGAPAQREVPTADGRCFLRRVSPYRALDDRVRGAVVTYADVSALKEAELRLRRLAHETEEGIRRGVAQLETEVAEGERAREALRTERDFVATVFETTNALIVVFDRAGRIVRFNRAFAQASGLAAAEIEGRVLWTLPLAAADEVEAGQRAAEAVFAGAGAQRGRSRWRQHDGSTHVFDWTFAALADGDGAVEYVVASAVDASAQHEAERALRAERDLLESVLQAVPTLIMMADRDGRIVRFNRAAEQATGLTAAQAIGRLSWETLLPPEEHESARLRFTAVSEGRQQHCESLLTHVDGSRRHVAWTLSALDGARRPNPYVIIAGVDVTELRAAAERERERLDELARLHRMHTAGELAAMLAHEINQPLAAIAHYSEAGLIQAGEATQRRFFQLIAEQAQRAGRTIHELRGFLDKAPRTLAPADPNAAAEAARHLTLADAAARGVTIELDLDRRLGPVAANAVQLQHILVNLIRNAVEAIAAAGMARGTIAVRTRRLDGPQRARITVEDSGPGIAAADADRVFTSFSTTKAEGLGMGLRISRRLAEASGGRLWVEPHQPGGRFHLELERVSSPLAAQEDA
jgi:PAS domain S-box-containing protein